VKKKRVQRGPGQLKNRDKGHSHPQKLREGMEERGDLKKKNQRGEGGK